LCETVPYLSVCLTPASPHSIYKYSIVINNLENTLLLLSFQFQYHENYSWNFADLTHDSKNGQK